jgi:hypothetical protein
LAKAGIPGPLSHGMGALERYCSEDYRMVENVIVHEKDTLNI